MKNPVKQHSIISLPLQNIKVQMGNRWHLFPAYFHSKLTCRGTSGQDGGIGRCTTKRRTTNLKIKNNQNCQKTELYGSLTTKELKKKHSLRLAGGAETGNHGGEDRQGGGWRTPWGSVWWSHI